MDDLPERLSTLARMMPAESPLRLAIEKMRDDAHELVSCAHDLQSLCRSAAYEIETHWASHCDSDGYGPVSLLYRLKGFDGRSACMERLERMCIVPAAPTVEMVMAAEEAYMPFGDMGFAIQSAITKGQTSGARS